jgi:V/A-type H+-transporting ATPase subunit E
MSIESLVGKILEDSQKAASEIQQRTSKDVKDREERAEKEIQRIMENAAERATRTASERKQRMLSMADLEDRKEILTVKQQLMDEAFNRAIERIVALDPEAYGTFLMNLILRASPEGDEEILLNERDKARLKDGWTDQLNRALAENKGKGEMRVVGETRSIRGGAVLRRGRKEVNCSIESVILSRRNELETTVAGVLFGESD